MFSGLVLFLFSLSARNIHNYDIWWHLAAGKYMIENHVIPRTDPFSFTRQGNAWIDLHWCFQLMVYQAYRFLGPAGLVGMKTATLFAAWLIMLTIPWSRSHFLAAGIILGLGMAAGQNTYMVRPTAVSLALLATCLAILEKGLRGNKRWLWVIPFLELVWVNFHSLFILGLFCIYSFLAGELFQWVVSRRREKAGLPPHIKTLSLVAAASTLACLVNPYNYHGLLFPLQLLQEVSGLAGSISESTEEFTPPFSTLLTTLPMRTFRALLWLSALSFVVNLKGVRLRHLLVYIGFAYLALVGIRNLSLFGLVASVITVYNFGAAWDRFRETSTAAPLLKHGRAAAVVCAGLIFGVSSLLACGLITDRIRTDSVFGAGVQWFQYPVGGAAFISRENVKGQGFNCFEDGGYLIWRFYPERRVFIDGRQEVSGLGFFDLYSRIVTQPHHWDELTYNWDLNYVLLNHTNASYNGLVRMLYHHPAYTLVYIDGTSALWVKRTGLNARIIRSHAIALDDIEPVEPPAPPASLPGLFERSFDPGEKVTSHLGLGRLYVVLGLPNMAMREYARAIELDPYHGRSYYLAGSLLYSADDVEKAKDHVEYSLSLDPSNVKAYALLGDIYGKTDPERAKKYYEKALDSFPNFGPVNKELACLYIEEGSFKKAMGQIDAARADRFYNPPPEIELYEARALAGLGKTKRARSVLEKYLKEHPEDAEALELKAGLEKDLKR